jgi:DNA polymerase-4
VATACYVARTFGVRSAMPMFKALKACPDALVIRPNMEKYRVAGREVRRLMLELTPLVEPISIDEAFLDLTGTARLHEGSPALTLARFAKAGRGAGRHRRLDRPVAQQVLAKIASDREKPRGVLDYRRADAASVLADMPVSALPGVGGAAQSGWLRLAPLIASLRIAPHSGPRPGARAGMRTV